MEREPKRIVEAGYDQIADRHLAWIDEIEGDPRLRFLDQLLTWLRSRVTGRPAVLDLGCGAGVPCTAAIAEHCDVVGVDLSTRQLALARERVPTARFVKADMTTVEFPVDSFDAVTAFYSIAHLPRDQHGEMFGRIASWLRPGGLLLASLGSAEHDGAVDDWLGAPMFFSSYDTATNRRLLSTAGFDILVDETVTMHEPEGPASFQWVIATRR